MPREDDEGEEGDATGAASVAQATAAARADLQTGGDVEAEVRALVAKARSRLDSVKLTMEDNGSKLKILQKGFRELKGLQSNAAQEQQKTLGSLMVGAKS
mmetsp:Transcript_124864/g.249340  ORF Transcript_124864/g.249340 Transcript_124864/m.249340 type:complete len:100 (-) Transcript_124864:17-316(-)